MMLEVGKYVAEPQTDQQIMLQKTMHQLGTQLKTVLIGKHKYFLKNIKYIDIFCNIHEQHCINQIDYYHRYVDIFRKLI